jgi:hypothetical protein
MSESGEESMTASQCCERPGQSRQGGKIENRELLQLRKQLADAWWNEAPLEKIEALEAAIARATGESERGRK